MYRFGERKVTGYQILLVCLIVILSFFSVGAKKKQKVSTVQTKQSVQEKTEGKVNTPIPVVKNIDLKVNVARTPPPSSPIVVPPRVSSAISNPIQKPIILPPKLPFEGPKDIQKIQDELKQVIARTQALQSKTVQDRVTIQQILDRARIHEQILRTISVPKPTLSNQQVNVEEISKREKLKLIAQDTERSKEQLRALETEGTLPEVKGRASGSAEAALPVRISKPQKGKSVTSEKAKAKPRAGTVEKS